LRKYGILYISLGFENLTKFCSLFSYFLFKPLEAKGGGGGKGEK
jgi:hypothetical protein